MIRPSITSSHLKSALLLLIFVTAWLSRSVHGWLGHEHKEHPACHAALESGVHLHDERYAAVDCDWCHFIHSIPDVLPAGITFQLAFHAQPNTPSAFYYNAPLVSVFFDHSPLRGPPC